jgi:dipeptidyl aminopeptidase/acylaminoacyl peptidase
LSLADGSVRVVARDFPARTSQPTLAVETQRLALLASRPGTGPPDEKMYSILRPTQDLVVVDLTSGQMRTLTDARLELDLADMRWANGGQTLFYRSVDPVTFRESIVRWDAATGTSRVVLAADEAMSDLSVSSDGGRLTFVAASATRPADGFTVTGSGEGRVRITNLNPQLAKFSFIEPVVIDFHSADGDPLKALLFKPAGGATGVPVVTYVYEKLTPQKNRFNPEAQLHVARGYAYLMPDVLVKPGYTGESFVKSVVPAVNAVRAMGFTNGRFGITGGSFGGYAGLFLISQVNVFAGAVVRAPPSEFFSTWGDGRDRDIWTIETGQARTGGTPWEVPERYIANSPFFFADRVRTPVLIMHGEKDFTVPLQQGEMMFYALRALGRTAELVLYREGDHSIVRGSRSDFLDFYSRMLGWWDRYLRRPPTDTANRYD